MSVDFGTSAALVAMEIFSFLLFLATVAYVMGGAVIGRGGGLGITNSSWSRSYCREWEGYWCGGCRAQGRTFDTGNLLRKGINLLAECINSRPIVFMDLIDYFYQDHCFFVGGCCPNFQLQVYLVE